MENNFGFCEDAHFARKIYDILADDLLGRAQRDIIETRYNDMRLNFNNYPKDSAKERPAWQFSEGLQPFRPGNRTNPYSDTTAVPIPITHPDFMDLTARTEKRGAIGLDLPTWFQLTDGLPRIMLVAQDPLRSAEWYGGDPRKEGKPNLKYGIVTDENRICVDAIVSSPFGLHDAKHREKGNGGKRMWLLVNELLGKGYGVYLTDCRKYFVYSHEESDKYTSDEKTALYKRILQKEIAVVKPQKIVALGSDARKYCASMGIEICPEQPLPHFSGAAGKQIKDYFDYAGSRSITEIAKMYANEILG